MKKTAISTKKRNVLFLLVDCLRADRCWGDGRTVVTPAINSLFERGTVFTQAISSATVTTSSVSSIFTGLYPFQHGVRALRGYKLRSKCLTMAEIFKKNRFQTYAEVSGPLFPELGFDRGFDVYNYRDKKHNVHSKWGDTLLTRFEGFKEPWFFFVHFWALHRPRQVLKEMDNKKYGKNEYDRAVSSLDDYLGRLLKKVDDNTILIFNSDHGEKMLSRIERLKYRLRSYRYYRWLERKINKYAEMNIDHGFHVFDYLVRVPLILVGKNIFPEGKIIESQVRQIDILPTLLDALDFKGKIEVEGRSLMPLINGSSMNELPAYCVANKIPNDKKKWLRGIRTSDYKYVYTPYDQNMPEELYDLRSDPQEKKNIISEKPGIAQSLREQLVKIYVEANKKESALADEEKMKKRLEELGYW